MRTVFGPPPEAQRPNPAAAISETDLDATQRELAARLMRINHAGEILRPGALSGPGADRAITQRARQDGTGRNRGERPPCLDRRAPPRARLAHELPQSALVRRLLCHRRDRGLAGDKWSLGFVAETERQVVKHLDGHLERLAPADEKSRAILNQMREDEGKHATVAIESGAAALPEPIRQTMRLMSKVMTATVYWI